MVRGTLIGAIVVSLALGGCLESAGPGKATSAGPTDGPKPPTTAAEYLRLLPQIKVLGPTTLEFSSANGTKEKPEVQSYFLWMSQKFRTSNLGTNGGAPVLFAMISNDLLETAPGCGNVGKGARAYFRATHGTSGNGRFNNISGEYDAGYYHIAIVSDAASAFQITFGSDDTVRPRTLPAQNVYVNASTVAKTGAREYAQTANAQGGTWFAWAYHRVGGTNQQTIVDGGRTHLLSIGGECVKSGGTDGGVTMQNNARTRSVSARGSQASFEIAAKYQPQQGALAPTDTTFEAAWVSVQTIRLPEYYAAHVATPDA